MNMLELLSSHFNSLIKYDGRVEYEILTQPGACSKENSEKDLILFGIKTMPQAVVNRKLLRDTWLGMVSSWCIFS